VQVEPGTVIVAEAGAGKYAQRIDVPGHTLRADEPAAYGGDDTDPSPYDLLLAALGACTSMTLRMYARRKQCPLRHVTVRLQHDRIHAVDCEECLTRSGEIDRIRCAMSSTDRSTPNRALGCSKSPRGALYTGRCARRRRSSRRSSMPARTHSRRRIMWNLRDPMDATIA
jgi:putative redox protein